MSCSKNNLALTYDDILLIPNYSDIQSRSEVSIANKLSDEIELEVPIFSAPMDTVSGLDMAESISRLGGCAIIHRYNTIPEQVTLVREAKRNGTKFVGAAVGATGDFDERAFALTAAGADFICIDIAHGHHMHMKNAIDKLKQNSNIKHVMAGNVATSDAYEDLAGWGADSVKVGIGNGSICSTRLNTGHGVPSVTALQDCARSKKSYFYACGQKAPAIIADGGIKNSGDIVKALAVGADFVMLGSMLAGTKEAPGELLSTANGMRKVYRGMASREAQNDWRGKSSAPEGISTTIPYKGELEPLFMDIVGGIKSGFSYTGARSIDEFKRLAKYVQQTTAGQHESWTHILSKA
jgi:IMP dehydrogenase